MIAQNALITNDNAIIFGKQLTEVIDSMQVKGYIVEIQYSTVIRANIMIYTALIIGKIK